MKTTFQELHEHILTTEARQPLDPFAYEAIRWLCGKLDEIRAAADVAPRPIYEVPAAAYLAWPLWELRPPAGSSAMPMRLIVRDRLGERIPEQYTAIRPIEEWGEPVPWARVLAEMAKAAP